MKTLPMRSLHREPLVHFLALGMCLFGLYAIVNPGDAAETDTRIVVRESDLAWLSQGFAGQWNRQPTASEMEGLVEEFVREEVYYREALALGLETDDTIIRRRLVQKMEFLSEDLALAVEPTEEALREFFDEHSDNYRIPPRLTFTHIYFSPDQRGATADPDARRVLGELQAMSVPSPRAADLGDPFMLQYAYDRLIPDDIWRLFGRGFSEALASLEAGVWHGPLESGYGLHLVRIDDRVEDVLPPFEEVRELVQRDFDSDRRLQMNADFYAALRVRYEIEIEMQDPTGADPVAQASVRDSQ